MTSEEPPTKEHVAFLECVIARCDAERHDLQHHAALQLIEESTKARKQKKTQKQKRKDQRKSLSEPRRIGLFGIPGAGKSSCLKLIRSYFEEVLGWVDGEEYQFLASQKHHGISH
jgi:ABC-type polysaccharide/polyol phosphate transport system ATPase subunit